MNDQMNTLIFLKEPKRECVFFQINVIMADE